ncbi:MAG: thioredoxin family protein [Pirellulaceae bacterium]|nr:thioredoxin family protein [Pirellulaceae bacterium]
MWTKITFSLLTMIGIAGLMAGCQGGSWGRSTDFSKATLSNEQAAELVRRETPTPYRWSNDYSRVLDQATREQKPMMLLFTGSDWCTYCTKLEKEVLSQPEFTTWAEDKFVPMMVDFPRSKRLASDIAGQNEQLKERYGKFVAGYPTILFVQPDGQVIGKMGYERGGAKSWIAAADMQVGPALNAPQERVPPQERMALEPASRRIQ